MIEMKSHRVMRIPNTIYVALVPLGIMVSRSDAMWLMIVVATAGAAQLEMDQSPVIPVLAEYMSYPLRNITDSNNHGMIDMVADEFDPNLNLAGGRHMLHAVKLDLKIDRLIPTENLICHWTSIFKMRFRTWGTLRRINPKAERA